MFGPMVVQSGLRPLYDTCAIGGYFSIDTMVVNLRNNSVCWGCVPYVMNYASGVTLAVY